MTTFTGSDRDEARVQEATTLCMQGFASRVWNETEYDTRNDPEDLREPMRSLVMLLAYRGWIDFSVS